MPRKFFTLDVFTNRQMAGNPLAVVIESEGLDDRAMQLIAREFALSETVFLLPPTLPNTRASLRIFTPARELPFAGHPTLGTCQAWRWAGGRPRDPDTIVQQCGVGLVRVRRDGDRLAFAAPPLRRAGPLDPGDLTGSETACDRQLCLPIFASMTEAQGHQVVNALTDAKNKGIL